MAMQRVYWVCEGHMRKQDGGCVQLWDRGEHVLRPAFLFIGFGRTWQVEHALCEWWSSSDVLSPVDTNNTVDTVDTVDTDGMR